MATKNNFGQEITPAAGVYLGILHDLGATIGRFADPYTKFGEFQATVGKAKSQGRIDSVSPHGIVGVTLDRMQAAGLFPEVDDDTRALLVLDLGEALSASGNKELSASDQRAQVALGAMVELSKAHKEAIQEETASV